MKRFTLWATMIVALSVAACSEGATEPSGSTFAVAYNVELPQGCNTEPYEGEYLESGEPAQEAGSGRTWYQGSDGRYYNCPQGGG